MSTIILQPPSGSPFDTIRRTRPDGSEYWSARDLMPLMGYRTWRNFEVPTQRAMRAADNQGVDVAANFAGSRKFTATKPQDDFELSRFAAYLVAMNGDPNKPEVAAAQAYFAGKTREAELAATTGPGDDLDVIEGMVRAMRADRRRIAALEQAQAETAAKVEAIEGQHDWFTALGYAKLHGHSTSRPYLMKVGKAATAIMRKGGQEPERRQDATFGTVNVYPSAVLEQAFAEVAP